jgi:Family of unknown function (DUF5367)
MNSREATCLRSVFGGVCAWLASIALLHWVPMPIRFDSRFTAPMAGLALADCAFFVVLVYFLVRRRPIAERFPATAAIAMPVAFGDAIAMAYFKDFFPKLNTDGSGMFAAFLLLTTAVILATGLIAGSRVVRE